MVNRPLGVAVVNVTDQLKNELRLWQTHTISHVKSTIWEQLSEWSTSAGFLCSKTVPIISWIIWHDLKRWQHTVTTLFLLNSFLVWSKGSTRKTFWKLIYKFIWLVWRSEKTTNRYVLNRVRNCIMERIRSCALLLVPLSASCHCILQEVYKVQHMLVLLIGQASIAGVLIIF